MNNLISKIVGVCLGLSLATGVAVGVGVGNQNAKEAKATSGGTISSFSAVSGNFDSNIEYTSYKGGGTSNPAINSSQIRLYQGTASNAGGMLVVKAKTSVMINSITIGTAMATTLGYKAGTEYTASTAVSNFTSLGNVSANGTKTISNLNTTVVTIACLGTTSSTRWYVNSLSVTYSSTSDPIPEPSLITGQDLSDLYSDNSGNGKQLYEVTGFVTNWASGKTDGTQFGNFYLAETSGGTPEYYVYGATETASALSWNSVDGIYNFTNPKDFLAGTLTSTIAIGDEVTMKLTRCDYTKDGVTTKETNGIVTNVVKHSSTYPEPSLVTGQDLSDLFADTDGNFKQLYEVTGYVSKWKSGETDGTQYGNFYLTETDSGGTEYYIYGATETTSALSWNENTGAYSFTNPQNFLTGTSTKTIVVGSQVTMKLTRNDYDASNLRASGIVTNVINPAGPELTIGSTYCIYKDSNYLTEMGDTYGIVGVEANALVLTARQGYQSGTYALETNGSYISWTSGNTLTTSDSITVNSSWTLTGTSLDNASIVSAADSTRIIQFNNSSNPKRFACYTGTLANASIKAIAAADPTVVATVELDKATVSVQVEQTVTLVATIRPSTATTQTASWLTSDSQVATVSAGVVTGVATGSATITAYADENGNNQLDSAEKRATCTVTVTAAPVPISGAYYQKVTSTANLEDGDYLIISEDSVLSVAFDGSLSTLDDVSNNVEVEISDNKIAATDAIKAKDFSIAETNDGYSIKSSSNYYIGQTSDANGMKTSTETAYMNAISFDNEGNADIVSGGAYLRYNSASNQDRFRYYKSSSYTGQNAVQLYIYVEEQQADPASDYADLFLEMLSSGSDPVCVVTQAGEVQTVLSNLQTAWEMLADEFDDLDPTDQALFTDGTANESGDNIAQALALYDYIATKYNTQLETQTLDDYNFMGRTITPASNVINPLINVDNNAAIYALVAISMVTMTVVGAYFFLRKKKEVK